MTNERQPRRTSSEVRTAFGASLDEALQVFPSLKPLEHKLGEAAMRCVESLRGGPKFRACGNGGNACEAQHLAGEQVGRYRVDRIALPAIAMTADSAVLTCIGNDYRFEYIFARQVEALGQPGDVSVAFTTSGNSGNILRALEAARTLSLASIAFLGRDGGAAALLADCTLIVPHMDAARVQEEHRFPMHSLMDSIEAEFGHVI